MLRGQGDVKALNIPRQGDVKLNELPKQIFMLLPLLLHWLYFFIFFNSGGAWAQGLQAAPPELKKNEKNKAKANANAKANAKLN